MERRFAEELIKPLRLHERVCEGWWLTDIEVDRENARIIYRLSSREMEIIVNRRDDRIPALLRTRNFNVSHKNDEGRKITREEDRAVKAVAALISANDTKSASAASLPEIVARLDPGGAGRKGKIVPVPPEVRTARSILFLVPGHLCNPMDITVRAIQVLGEVSCIFVEDGKTRETKKLLESYGVPVRGKSFVEVPFEPNAEQSRNMQADILRTVERGENLCLFGVNEGIPGFMDPGKALLREVSRCGCRVRIESLGGPSALSTALMRSEITIVRFFFIGNLDNPDCRSLLLQALEQVNVLDHSLIFYSTGKAMNQLWPEFQDLCRKHSCMVEMFCDLTMPTEKRICWTPEDTAAGGPQLDRDQKLIVIASGLKKLQKD